MMLYLFGLVRATVQRQGMRTSSIYNTHHVATRLNEVAKRTQHVAPNMLHGKVAIVWPGLDT